MGIASHDAFLCPFRWEDRNEFPLRPVSLWIGVPLPEKWCDPVMERASDWHGLSRSVSRRRLRNLDAAEIRLLEPRTFLSGSNTAPTVSPETFSVNENSVNGTLVGTVVANDPDVTDTLTYAITAGNAGGAFAINASSGEITVANASALDFETTPSFAITVQATDDGMPNLSGSATVTINLNNVNEPPSLSLGSSIEFIDENSSTAIALIVTSVTVSDDALGNETLSVSGPDAAFFEVVGSTLRVKAGTVLNFEAKDNYSVTVNVNDATVGGNPDDSEVFTLLLNDLPEPPVMANQSFQVLPGSGNGTSVGTVVASDPDGGPLLYAILSGNTGGAFQLDPSTGEITVADSAAVTTTNSPFSLTVRVTSASNEQQTAVVTIVANNTTTVSGGLANQPVLDTEIISPFAMLNVTDADNQAMSVRVSIPNGTRGDFTPASSAGWTRTTVGEVRYSRSFNAAPNIGAVVQNALRALVFQVTPNQVIAGTEETLGFPLLLNDQVQVVNDSSVSIRITSVNDLPTIDGAVANQPVNDNATIAPFTVLTVTDPDRQASSVSVTINNGINRGDFTPASSTGWTRSVNGNDLVYSRSIIVNGNIGSEVQAVVRPLVFQPRSNAIAPGTGEITTFTVVVNDQFSTATDSATSVIASSVNNGPVLGGAVANQAVSDQATLAPFATLTVTDPDTQAMSALVRITNGVVRGDFTAATTAGWTRSVSGNNITYARTYPAGANIGGTVQAAIRALIFQPRSNAIKPNTTEVASFTVTVTDGVATPVSNSTTSVITTSINDAPTIGGASAGVTVNDNASVNPFSTLTVSEPDHQEMLAKITIYNGAVRGDFSNAVSSGWTRSTLGNNINYVRYFSPGLNIGATVQGAFRALVFQPRTNAIKPGTTELTDFLVSVSDGVAPAVANSGTRVTATSINDATVISGAVAGQLMNDNETRAVFNTLVVADADTQEMLVRVTITNGVNRGDLTTASTTGWTRSVSGTNIVYTRYFNATVNIGGNVQTAIRALIFQPRNNVPVGQSESTQFTVFVNDGNTTATNSDVSAITTGVAPRTQAPVLFDSGIVTAAQPLFSGTGIQRHPSRTRVKFPRL